MATCSPPRIALPTTPPCAKSTLLLVCTPFPPPSPSPLAFHACSLDRYEHMDYRLEGAVEHAERQSARDAGWTLRHGMDAVLHVIHAGGQLQSRQAQEMSSSSSSSAGDESSAMAGSNPWWSRSSSWSSWGGASSTYEACTTCNDDGAEADAHAPAATANSSKSRRALLYSSIGLIGLGMVSFYSNCL